MDDTRFGVRDARGNWRPNTLPDIAPIWRRPWDPERIGRWLVDLLWPWNAFHLAVSLVYWWFVLPDPAVMRELSWHWVLPLFAANAIGILLLFGGVELFYYIRRIQGTRFKYNPKFPADHPSDVFWFRSQNLDNFIRTFFMSIPIWTAVQSVFLWAFANGWGTMLDWQQHWPWLVLLMFFVPFIHDVYFFCIHWLIHRPVLYKWVHSVHHNSINPSPWSSLSMHPVESFLYFCEVFVHLLIPSHPFVGLFNINMIGYGAINGHIGFDRLEVTEEGAIDNAQAYIHYLHHKYFEVNYGADGGLIPLDYWFGTWHDGSREADERMKERFRRKKQRLAARSGARPATGH